MALKFSIANAAGKKIGTRTFYPEPLVKGVFKAQKSGRWYKIIKVNNKTKTCYVEPWFPPVWQSMTPIGVKLGVKKSAKT